MNRMKTLLVSIAATGLVVAAVVTAQDSHDEHDHDKHAEHEEEEHEGHDEHEEHEGHEEHEEGVVHLNADKLRALKPSTVTVRYGALSLTLELPGEVRWNATRVAHVVPRVPGVVRKVNKRLGDAVQDGETLAVLDSRELASAKAAYLAAIAREKLAESTFTREERLFKQKVSAERDYLEAQNVLAEARIERRLTHLQLYAIGLSEAEVEGLPEAPDSELTLYRMTAPFAGIVVERHIVRGEMLKDDSQAFEIVDTSNVWVIGQAYERDLRLLKKQQKASVRLDAFPNELFKGTVAYIANQLDPETRTVQVRVVLDNQDARFRAGMFGEVSVFSDATAANTTAPTGLLIPRGAMQRVRNGFVVFRQTEPDTFRVVPVQVHGESKEHAIVTGDLRAGDLVAIGDTFLLKSEAAREEMGGGHSH